MPILYILEIIWTVCFIKRHLWPHPWALSNSLWTSTSLMHPLPLKLHPWSFMPLELHPSLDGVWRWQVLTKSNRLVTCFQGVCLSAWPVLTGESLVACPGFTWKWLCYLFLQLGIQHCTCHMYQHQPALSARSFCKTPNYHICNQNNLCVQRPGSVHEQQARWWR